MYSCSSAKQAVVICSIMATLICFGAVVWLCVPLFAETFIQEYFECWNITICQCLGVAPPDPRIWDCLLGQTRTPLLKSLRKGLLPDVTMNIYHSNTTGMIELVTVMWYCVYMIVTTLISCLPHIWLCFK